MWGNVMKINLTRRTLVKGGTALATSGALMGPDLLEWPKAWAQAYPNRPVRILVGYPAGGLTDIVARLMSHWLSERLGQQFIVENRTGFNTNIATEAVVKAPPDGYTLLLATGANAGQIRVTGFAGASRFRTRPAA
jgi:tripartite-type tricarboxylate transporter receptor subunit TctC